MERELITNEDPKSPISEVFRTLRTNIQFMTSNKGIKTLLVTSSVPGEGKSWVSSNLATAFAQEGKKVLIIDSDMRKGRLHTIFETTKKPGLSNYLSGMSDLEEKENVLQYIQQTQIENLYLMPAGDVPPNPSELLVSEKTKALIQQLKEIFDLIIFDGTPCLLVTDSIILGRQVDTTLIVTAYKTTKMGDVEKIKKSIEKVGGKIAGVVINKIPISSKKYQNTYYYGDSSDKTQKEVSKEERQEDILTQIEELKQEVRENPKDKGE